MASYQWISSAILSLPFALFTLISFTRWCVAVADRHQLVAMQVRFPAPLRPQDVTAWMSAVAGWSHPRFGLFPPTRFVAIETVAEQTGITHHVVVAKKFRQHIVDSVQATLPGARLMEDDTYLAARPRPVIAAAWRLTSRDRPLATTRVGEAASTLLAAMQPLRDSEQIRVQWLMASAGTPEPPRRSRPTDFALPWWLDDTTTPADLVRAQTTKFRHPLLGACGRIGIVAPSDRRARQLLGRVWPALHQLNAPGIRVIRRWLPGVLVGRLLNKRRVPLLRWPMRINAEEAPGFIGLPVGGAPLPGLPRRTARQLPPHPTMARHGTVIARSNYPGAGAPLMLTANDRLRHTWVLGPTGVGKTTLLANMATQDITAGAGVVLIDMRGDLVTEVLARVPADRAHDVVFLEPATTTRPIGFNALGGTRRDAESIELAVDQTTHVLHDLFRASWGPRTADVIRCGLLTLAATVAPNGEAFTVCELPPLLLDPVFRRYVVSQPRVPAGLVMFWRWFDALSDAERAQVIGPSLNKIRAFTTRTPLRLLLGQSSGLDFGRVMAEGKVLLISLPKGRLGGETAQLIGSLLVAALWNAVLGRAAVPENRRMPVWMYIDEFQETMRLPLELADMFAQARALGVGITVSHQYLDQLAVPVRHAVLGTARTHVVFQLGYDDAKALAPRYAPLNAEELASLDLYEIAMRPCVGGVTLGPVTGTTTPLTAPNSDPRFLADLSAERYGVPWHEVEAALVARTTVPQAPLLRRRS